MSGVSDIRHLFGHMRWADALIWKTVEDNPPCGEDGKVRELMYHIHTVQLAFARVWTNRSLGIPKAAEFENMNAIIRWGKDVHGEMAEFLARTNENELTNSIKVPWSTRVFKIIGTEPAETTLSETMYQAIMHSQHHRAQVCSRIRELGVQPPPMDFIIWVWMGKPAPVESGA